MRLFALSLMLLFLAAPAGAQSLPRSIYVDPPDDPHAPARLEVLHIPSGEVKINGIAYVAAGPGPHPTALLLHGMPGNEKNLDLAQAMRRAGWTVVAINYRGIWGSPGTFHFAQTLEDTDAALAYLRAPDNAAKLGIDTRRLVLVGHSMGAWIAARTLAHDHALLGAALISPGDLALIAQQGREAALSFVEEDRESIAEPDSATLADELMAHSADWQLTALAPQLAESRMLLLYSNDFVKDHALKLLDALKAARSKKLTVGYTATDHAWSDHRIALQAQVINWLESLPGKN
jgi:pimeloyl-ACP methyl ester carboxylesterase